MAKCSCHSDDEVKEETSPCSCGEGDICNCEDACSCAEDNLDCQCHEHEHSHAAKKSCGCGCDDDDEEEEEDVKETLKLIAFSALWLILAIAVTKLLDLPVFAQLLVFLPAYFSSGADVLKSAGKALLKGRPFNENFLMSVATVGALAIAFVPGGSPEFAEAIFVMLFYKVGELFEDIAHDRSRRSIESLMDIRPDSAVVLRDGKHVALDAKEISVGEIIYVSAGERIALDGTIVEGTSALDTSALTGESAPVDCVPGDSVLSGSVNLSGTLTVKTTSTFQNSTASRILSLVESAEANKSKSERMISKFARYYTPAVVFAALALAILGPIFEGDFEAHFASWLLRALTFLIVSCPCALVVSVPLSFFGGIGAASKQGILIKGANYLEALAKADTAAFDKTGTLTEGRFEVKLVHTEAISQDELLHLAAHVEALSKHPIAVALREAFPDAVSANDNCEVTDIQEIAGKGITASVNGHKVSVGNAAFMEEVSEGATDCCKDVDLNIVHVAQDGKYLGHIVCEDVIKENAKEAISKLKDAGIAHTIMLSGDRASVAQKVATQLGISEAMAELLPQQKVACFEHIMEKHQNTTSSCIYVGDGINDAPVLARADVGIAMGGVGSDVAIEAADVVLMDDNLAKVAKAIQISKHTLQIAWQNVGIALGVKLLILVLAALGLAPMWLAVFGDTGVLMLCVANASRTLKVPK